MRITTLFAVAALTALSASAEAIPSGIENLYLVGEAAPAYWDNSKAPAFTKKADGIFEWTGTLRTGQFKMTVSRDNWNSLVSAVQDNETMVLDTPMAMMYKPEADNSIDWKWYNNEAGNYTLTADINNATLTVVKAGGEIQPAFSQAYIIGSAVASGWDRDSAPELTKEEDNNYTWTGELKAGEFKFLTSRDRWDSVVAMNPDTEVELGSAMPAQINVDGGGNDYKWVIKEDGNYVVKLNSVAMTMTINKSTISKIVEIEDTEANAVYYNMSGVRVSNPADGIFIKVANGKAVKVRL